MARTAAGFPDPEGRAVAPRRRPSPPNFGILAKFQVLADPRDGTLRQSASPPPSPSSCIARGFLPLKGGRANSSRFATRSGTNEPQGANNICGLSSSAAADSPYRHSLVTLTPITSFPTNHVWLRRRRAEALQSLIVSQNFLSTSFPASETAQNVIPLSAQCTK